MPGKFFNSFNSSSENSEIAHPKSQIHNSVACGRAIRSYCTGLIRWLTNGIRSYP